MIGLSELQKNVLILAYQRRHTTTGKPVDLYSFEVYRDIFDLPCRYTAEYCLNHPGSPLFSPDEIGRDRYNSIKSSVSRTFAKLDKRGFAERRRLHSAWAGIRLTALGVRVGRNLEKEAG